MFRQMTATKQHKKVILVGDGAVGSSYAFALVTQGIAQELGIIEIPQLFEKAVGDAEDLSHALAFTSPKKIYAAKYEDCADADLVVITAGAPQKPGETRLDLVGKNLANIMGEHGDSEFAVWSHANVAGVKLEQWLQSNRDLNEADLVELFISVRDAAYSIINKKGATYYGIAVALARITKAILDDENAVLPLSVFQEGQYGVENVFIGQPAIVGAHGIVRPVNIPLNDAETQKMQASAKELQEIINEAWKNPEFQAASKN